MVPDFVGSQKIKELLQLSWSGDKLAQCYCITGPDHIGKKTLANLLANKLLCGDKKSEWGCAECFNCQQFQKNLHPDYKIIENGQDENISIEQIKDIKTFLNFSSLSSVYRIVVINYAQNLSNEAANSLLKLLEEPLPNSIIILLTVNERKLLPTVISRCQIVRLTRVIGLDAQLKKFGINSSALSLFLAKGLPGLLIGRVNIDSDEVVSTYKLINEYCNNRNSGIEKLIKYLSENTLDSIILVVRDLLLASYGIITLPGEIAISLTKPNTYLELIHKLEIINTLKKYNVQQNSYSLLLY